MRAKEKICFAHRFTIRVAIDVSIQEVFTDRAKMIFDISDGCIVVQVGNDDFIQSSIGLLVPRYDERTLFFRS